MANKKHPSYCICQSCMRKLYPTLYGRKSPNHFSATTKRGDTIWGDKKLEKRPDGTGYEHGHDWGSGYRTPHQSVGHAAVHGKPGHRNDHIHNR